MMGIFAQSFFSQNATFAYQPICASGKNACVLHYITNDSVIDQQKPILLDVGAEVCGYDADITRTINITTKRQEAIYTAVLAVQEFAISLLKPGVYLKEYEQKVREFMGRQLITLKLIKKATPKAIAELYPHGTGHFLGLDTHDVGDYKKPLAAGMVITVEPGIYSKKEGIGIRIEDNILITKTGCKVLSAMIPK
ncbi:MAG: Xaa-Pro aminopeptidase [Candidatus Woesearchaeota archaeon]